MYIAPLSISVLGNLEALGFYALALRFVEEQSKREDSECSWKRVRELPSSHRSVLIFLQHPLHTLMFVFFIGNIVGSFFFWMIHVAHAGTIGCGSEPSAARESGKALALFYPPVMTVVFGVGVIGVDTTHPDTTICWMTDPWSAQGKLIAIGAMITASGNVFMTVAIVWNILRRSTSKGLQTSTTALRATGGAAAALSGVGESAREDSEVVTRRLVLYPFIVIISGCLTFMGMPPGNTVAMVAGGQLGRPKAGDDVQCRGRHSEPEGGAGVGAEDSGDGGDCEDGHPATKL
ncbi:hypothetical protein M427DRAFT_500654 [Gonapodya prolifera JEL478]|uniref:Uncharacterized protein n=1 Tax=Gonapodya prolifera (strain JEL478) TaxID=1344416 RepID=A0A139AAI5_GONPJ|nr:hypothetical protein M427DRAFT_500654 [Gonapodya prolifera JEL478]|eukprot:KXS13383.1 hypothetical protein M427DRAFT_500654 [Gonapodya prolifera JEL478]